MLFAKVSCCIDWTCRIILIKAYAYLDKNKSLGVLDRKIKIMKIFLENITQFIE